MARIRWKTVRTLTADRFAAGRPILTTCAERPGLGSSTNLEVTRPESRTLNRAAGSPQHVNQGRPEPPRSPACRALRSTHGIARNLGVGNADGESADGGD